MLISNSHLHLVRYNMLISNSHLHWVLLSAWYCPQLGYCLICWVLVMLSTVGYDHPHLRIYHPCRLVLFPTWLLFGLLGAGRPRVLGYEHPHLRTYHPCHVKLYKFLLVNHLFCVICPRHMNHLNLYFCLLK